MPLLTITDLQKAYVSPEGSQTPIIDIPHFEMEEGTQTALRGSSGAGKTTFLNLIAGILQADSGRIVVAGEEMTALSESGRDRLRASHIGYIFQTFNLLPGYTALENVMLGMMFGKGIDADFAGHVLERMGLGDRLKFRTVAVIRGAAAACCGCPRHRQPTTTGTCRRTDRKSGLSSRQRIYGAHP